jgi:hypothetical protein
LDESLLLIWRQIARGVSSGFANAYSDSGGAQTPTSQFEPSNLHASQQNT